MKRGDTVRSAGILQRCCSSKPIWSLCVVAIRGRSRKHGKVTVIHSTSRRWWLERLSRDRLSMIQTLLHAESRRSCSSFGQKACNDRFLYIFVKYQAETTFVSDLSNRLTKIVLIETFRRIKGRVRSKERRINLRTNKTLLLITCRQIDRLIRISLPLSLFLSLFLSAGYGSRKAKFPIAAWHFWQSNKDQICRFRRLVDREGRLLIYESHCLSAVTWLLWRRERAASVVLRTRRNSAPWSNRAVQSIKNSNDMELSIFEEIRGHTCDLKISGFDVINKTK